MTKQITRPDFQSLNGQQLVDAYNQYVSKWRTSKFSSKSDGVEACNRAFDSFVKSNGYEVIEATPADIPDEFEQAQEDYDRAQQVEAEVIADLETKVQYSEHPEEEQAAYRVNLRLIGEMYCSDELKERFKKLLQKGFKSPAPRKTKNGDKVIKIKVLRNPRREGTQAWKHFAVMNRSDVKTVSDYLSHFENRKNASQWLSNTIADGFVELVDEA